MNMIDDTVLSDALHEVGDSFEISRDALRRILREATSPEIRLSRSRAHAWSRPRSTRPAVVTAVLVVAFAAIVSIAWPLLRSEPHATRVALNATQRFSPLPSSEVNGTGLSPGKLSVATGTVQSSRTVTSAGGVQKSVANSAATSTSKIESTGTVVLRVKNGTVASTLASLSSTTTRDGGFVFSTQASTRRQSSLAFATATIVLQVPQQNFETLIAQVSRVGRATSIFTTSNDVTSQYVDLRARIAALDFGRRQYLAIMTRATSIGAILAVQNQLNTIQGEIEQLQGQLNVLNRETTYATLSVTLAEAGQSISGVHHRSGLVTAWRDAIAGFVAGFEWLIRLSGPMLFAVLLLSTLAALAALIRRGVRRRRL